MAANLTGVDPSESVFFGSSTDPVRERRPHCWQLAGEEFATDQASKSPHAAHHVFAAVKAA